MVLNNFSIIQPLILLQLVLTQGYLCDNFLIFFLLVIVTVLIGIPKEIHVQCFSSLFHSSLIHLGAGATNTPSAGASTGAPSHASSSTLNASNITLSRPSLSKMIISLKSDTAKQVALQHVLDALQVRVDWKWHMPYVLKKKLKSTS
jgi:hypothetical protein